MKGYLLSKGWELKRTHNLIELLDYVIKYESSFEDFRELCQRASVYYTVERYPTFVSIEIAEEEIQEALGKTTELKEKILNYFRR